MREVKFKAQLQDTKEWIVSNGFMKHYDGTIIVITKQNKDDFETSPIVEGTLREFTGLKDKNGKEIYEGDIALWDTTEAENKPIKKVNWNNELSCYCFGNMPIHNVFESGFYQPSDGRKPYPGEGFEVIGNIHENKNLIK